MEDAQRQEAQEAQDILDERSRKAPLWAATGPSYSASSHECWNPLRASDAAKAAAVAAAAAAAVVRSTIVVEKAEATAAADTSGLEPSEAQEVPTGLQTDEEGGVELGEEWERSFAAYTERQQRPTALPSAVEPSVSTVQESDLSSRELEDLIETSEMGLPVSWPSGLDIRAAQGIIKARANSTSGEAAATASPPEAQAENWRQKKRRIQSEKEAATRPRVIPTMEEAMTPAAIIIAKMAAKFRRKN